MFWLSESKNIRESDATLLYEPWKMIRFDIGFIGPGNSEISKDKLSRFSAEEMYFNKKTYTKTIIIVDRLPKTGKTEKAAKNIKAGIVQMSMKYWPKELAILMGKSIGMKHPLQKMNEPKISEYLEKELSRINIMDFVSGFNINDDNEEIESTE